MRYLFCLLAVFTITLSEGKIAQATVNTSDKCLDLVDQAIDNGVDVPECEE